MTQEKVGNLDSWDDHDLLRFCRARKFDLAGVKLMFRACMEWRHKNNVDDHYEKFDFPEET